MTDTLIAGDWARALRACLDSGNVEALDRMADMIDAVADWVRDPDWSGTDMPDEYELFDWLGEIKLTEDDTAEKLAAEWDAFCQAKAAGRGPVWRKPVKDGFEIIEQDRVLCSVTGAGAQERADHIIRCVLQVAYGQTYSR